MSCWSFGVHCCPLTHQLALCQEARAIAAGRGDRAAAVSFSPRFQWETQQDSQNYRVGHRRDVGGVSRAVPLVHVLEQPELVHLGQDAHDRIVDLGHRNLTCGKIG